MLEDLRDNSIRYDSLPSSTITGLDADLLDGHEWTDIEQADLGRYPLHGFTYPYDVTLSYDSVTRTITLTQNGEYFSFWVNGIQFTKITESSTPHSNITGQYYFTYDYLGQINISSSPWDLTDFTKIPICVVYYNQNLTDGFANFELHRAQRNIYAHKQSHFAIGTFVKNPASHFSLSDYTLTTGTNAGVRFSISSGSIMDEDIEWAISALNSGGPYTMLYRSGVTDWAWTTTNSVPYLYNAGTNKIQINSNSGGNFSLTDVTNNNYVNYYLFATSAIDVNKRLFLIPGQTIYSSLTLANEESFLNLNFASGIPLEEFAPLWKITYRYQTGSSSTGRARIESITKLQGTKVSVSMSGSGSAHNSLSGRSDADSHPGAAISNTPSGTIIATTIQSAINELDTNIENLKDTYLENKSSILSSISPTNNGELVFEATSNTTITIKYKGTDGVVRSGTISLS